MSTLETAVRRVALVAAVGCLGVAAVAVAQTQTLPQSQAPRLGKAISESDVQAWDIDVSPNGKGLPPGNGIAAAGAKIYAEKCSACHKADLSGFGSPNASALTGANRWTFVSYVEHPTTLFDVIRRTMPLSAPRTLSNDEVYALTAYLLAANKIIAEDQVMNAQTLPKVKMPSAGKSVIRFPDRI